MNQKKMFKTAIVIGVITFLAKLLGLLRESFIANIYGTTYQSQAFLAATRIPTLIFDVTIGGVISATFIPIFNSYLNKKDENGKTEAMDFANQYIQLVLLITMAITGLGIIFAKPLIGFTLNGPDITDATRQLAVSLSNIMFPMIIFTGLAFSFVGILHSYGQFYIPAILSLLSNISIIGYLTIFGDKGSIHGLSYVMLIAWSLQALIQVPWLIKFGFKYRPTFRFQSKGIRKAASLAPQMLISTWVQPVTSILVIRMASYLDKGRAVSAYEYSNRLYLTIVGIFTFVISNLVFPLLAKANSSEDDTEMKKLSVMSIKFVIAIMMPIVVGLLILDQPIVRLVFERGQFDAEDTYLTALALKYSSIGMVFYALNEIFNKIFYALQDSKTPMYTAMTGMFVNIGLVLFLPNLIGIVGLSLSMAAGAIVNCILSYVILVKKKGEFLTKNDIPSLIKIVVAVIIMGVVVIVMRNTCAENQILSVVVPITTGALTYLGACVLLRVQEVTSSIKLIFRKGSDDIGE